MSTDISMFVLAEMRAASTDINAVQRRATAHEKTIAFGATEANVGANFGQQYLSDAFALWLSLIHI